MVFGRLNHNHFSHFIDGIPRQCSHCLAEIGIIHDREQRIQQVILQAFFRDHQVVSFAEQWNEIQIQRASRSRDRESTVRPPGGNRCSHGQVEYSSCRTHAPVRVECPFLQFIIQQDPRSSSALPVYVRNIITRQVPKAGNPFRVPSGDQ